MKPSLLLAFLLLASNAHAALTLLAREPFVGTGTLTAGSPGGNFNSVFGTLTKVPVGAKPFGSTDSGWSADLRDPNTGTIAWGGQFNFTADRQPRMLGLWVRFKGYPDKGNYIFPISLNNGYGLIYSFGIDSNGFVTSQLNGSTPTVSTTQIPLNTWAYLAAKWEYLGGNNLSYGVGLQILGGSFNPSVISVASTPNYSSSLNSVVAGLATPGASTSPPCRISCPSLYAMDDYTTDFVYPTGTGTAVDIVPPVEQPNYWYVNTATGSDSYDGTSATVSGSHGPWRTAAKINLESQYSGMLDSNAPGPGGGDVLTIDTSGAPLVIGTSTLTFATQGLLVQPCAGQASINCQAEEPLANAGFTPTDGLSNTYQTADTQTNIVAWENDKWMYHVKSAFYGAPAAIRDPSTGITTSYDTTGAALDATPGSFYTDGTTLYIHPFGDTNPATDGKYYTRSINRNQLAAVAFTAGNYRAIGFTIRKTCLVDSGDNDFGAYCFQDGVLAGTGFSSSVENGIFTYGDKHCFGSTTGLTNSTLLVLNTDCEQGHPYCGYGGQVPFVSYTGQTTGDNVHIYRGCTCLARAGRIGSTVGDPGGNGGDIIYCHNNGGGASFASITLDHCHFASGSVDLGVTTNLNITQSQVGAVSTSCPNTTIQQTTFTNQIVQMYPGAANLVLQNCLIKPVFALSQAPPYSGLVVLGNVSIEGCTFDLAGITGDSGYFQQGIIQETGTTNLTFRNNAYVVPAGEDLPLLSNFTSADTLTFYHNAYVLGAGTTIARGYSADQPALSFTQWQALGQDVNGSAVYTDLGLQNDIPQPGSPLLDAGYNLGQAPDFTGTLYSQRDTIGAYQVSDYPLLPQTLASLPPSSCTAVSDSFPLPAATDAGLPLTYAIESGPAQISGITLTFTGAGTVVLLATQAGDDSYSPFSFTETITVSAAATPLPDDTPSDTPTLPTWALLLLGASISVCAARSLRTS